jgi:uncharacterized membrane protein YadS
MSPDVTDILCASSPLQVGLGISSRKALPAALGRRAAGTAGVLTIVSMAALGLGVDVRALASAGPRASAVVALSLGVICALALLLVRSLGL